MHFDLHVWRLENKYQIWSESLISSQIPSNENQNQNHEIKHQVHQINEKMKSSLISLENLWTKMSEIPAVERSFQESTSSNAWSNKSEDKIEFDISRTLCTRVSEIHAVERFYPRGQDPTQCASNPITTQNWKINNRGNSIIWDGLEPSWIIISDR